MELQSCVRARLNPSDDDQIAELINEICDHYVEGSLRLTGFVQEEAFAFRRDRRCRPRSRISVPIYLWPVNPERVVDPSTSAIPQQIAVTRDLSYRGVGMESDRPFDHPFFIAEFDGENDRLIHLLLEVCWTQEKSSLHYIAGCRILSAINNWSQQQQD